MTPHREVGPDDTFVMIFTSGTSGDPKAVQVQHMMPIFAGSALAERYSVGTSDVCYVSMPLFHSNSIYAGWGVALVTGAAMVPAVFSVSRFLDDVRRYGVTYMNYVGKPLAYILATPESPTTTTIRCGSRSATRPATATSTSSPVASTARSGTASARPRTPSSSPARTAARQGSIGKGFPGVAIYDPETLQECEVAEFDDEWRLCSTATRRWGSW